MKMMKRGQYRAPLVVWARNLTHAWITPVMCLPNGQPSIGFDMGYPTGFRNEIIFRLNPILDLTNGRHCLPPGIAQKFAPELLYRITNNAYCIVK
jgi:hypothetical protein